MKTNCLSCSEHKSHYLVGKPVCLRCDELLFDIEIECDEDTTLDKSADKSGTVPLTSRAPRR